MARNSLTATLGGALRGYPAVYVVHDRNVARYAEQIAALKLTKRAAFCYAALFAWSLASLSSVGEFLYFAF